ncbi:MAG TPA: DUF3240 family protein [Alphaproteobacteria bacterium]|nr:DUF3240 family protein [Alphaproteobacteria bacterium]
MTMTDTAITYQKLTLVCPEELAERLVDLLLDTKTRMTGFTTTKADGHGHDFTSASARERVRGRVARRAVVAVLPADDVPLLLDEIHAQIKNPHLAYWTEPVLAYGQLS